MWLCGLLFVCSCGRLGFDRASAGGDAGGDAGAGPSGPLALPDTGIDLTDLEALWTFDAPSAVEGAAFPAFPDANLVATLETGDASDNIDVGVVGAAIHFDGVDDRLVAVDAPAFDISGPHSMTVWVFMDQVPANDYGLVGKESAYTLEVESDTGCIDLAVYRPSGGFDELVSVRAPPETLASMNALIPITARTTNATPPTPIASLAAPGSLALAEGSR